MIKGIAGLALLCTAVGCVSKLDTERRPADEGSFGQTVLTLMCKRVAYLEDLADGDGVTDVRGDTYRDVCRLGLPAPGDAPAALKALEAKRDELEAAVDTTFPEDFLSDLQTFLTANDFLALYDDGTTIAATDDLVEMLRFMADDAEFAPALERLGDRIGYMPMQEALGAVRSVVNYPDMHAFLLAVLDQITEGGQAKGEWDNVVAALGVTMRNAEPVADLADPERTGQLGLDVLFSTNDLLGTSHSIPMVRRDYRGLARVAVGPGGSLPLSFVDEDSDGLADADDLGRFVDAGGNPLDDSHAPAPFDVPSSDVDEPWLYRDAEGRALDGPGGDYVYDYVDLDKTVFAAVTRDAIDLFDPQKGTALDLLRGGSALMSSNPRQLITKTYENGDSLEYRGYDTSASPLLDMLFGYMGLLRYPEIEETLTLVRKILVDHEPEIARIIEMGIDAAEIADLYPDAKIPINSPLWDDMIPVIRQMLEEPGLVEDLLRAMEDPAVAELGMRFREYMKYKDQLYYDADQVLHPQVLSEFVDRSQGDSGFNRSLMERLLHIINDSNGAVMCNKEGAEVGLAGLTLKTYPECQLLQIDNLAVFYVQSIAYNKDANGNILYDDDGEPQRKARFPFQFDDGTFLGGLIDGLVDDDLLQSESGIDGFKYHPTPEALNRVLFLDPMPEFLANTMDPAKCKDGDYFYAAHSGTLMVWELNGFYDQIRPIIQVFADHDKEQLFVDLLSVLHKHWPTRDSAPTHQFNDPDGHGYVWGSGIATYEPMIVDILERRIDDPARGNILDALSVGSSVLNQVTVDGRSMPEIMEDTARYLMEPRAGLRNRLGNETSETSDGVPIPVLSPYQIIADAYHLKAERLEVAAEEGEAWQRSTGNLVDVMFRADPVVSIGWTFRNPRIRGVTLALIDFLQSRIDAHDAVGDRDDWLTDDLPGRTEDVLAGPVFAGLADFVLSLQASPEARAQIESLASYLVNEVNYNETFRTSLVAIADTMQLALDDRDIVPIAHVAGEALRPSRGWVDTSLEFVKRARHSDENQALVRMFRNLFDESRSGHTAVNSLIDGISEIHRNHPYDEIGARYTAEDYRALMRGLAQFLDDEKRGLRRFISIIEGRNL